MNNINKGNEIRLCSIEQHTPHHILIYYYCFYTVRVCPVHVEWIISLIDIADKNNK